MKKQILCAIMSAVMVAGTLTGCGDNKEVTKTDEAQVEISTEKESKSTEKVVEETTEVATEETTEEVKADFLTENGLTITPNGTMTMALAKTGTEETVDANVTTSVTTTVSSEEGYSDTTFVAEATTDASDFYYYTTSFDRYTGTDFEGGYTDFGTEGGSTHKDVAVIDVDGKQYDCGLTISQERIDLGVKVTITIHHPSEYDGGVFQLGKLTASQQTVASGIDYSKAFVVTDYPELLDGQYFFTATDK